MKVRSASSLPKLWLSCPPNSFFGSLLV